jgi:outer membrane PBP1 activator LpoA protein
MHVAVIAPDTVWGRELVNFFKITADNQPITQLVSGKATRGSTNQGIKILAEVYYAKDSDFMSLVGELTSANTSKQRIKNLRDALGQKVNGRERARKDLDAIILLGSAKDAKQIQPMLQFYYVNSIAVFALSNIYNDNTNSQANLDLENIMFCDIPWILTDYNDLPEYLRSIKAISSDDLEHNNLVTSRLFALGIDAYNLLPFFTDRQYFPAQGVIGATGILSLDHSSLRRGLIWAKFKNGLANALIK